MSRDTVTSGWPSALIRSAARNSRSVIGSVEHRASTSPLAEVKYSGRLARRCGNTISTMKFAVCSRSSAASRSPPTVTRGTLAVAALPIGFARRSRILLVWLMIDDRRVELVEDDTEQLPLCPAQRGDDVFHAVVDVEIDRQHRGEAVADIEQLAVRRAPRHRRAIEDHQIETAGGTLRRDGLADG